MAPTAVAEAPRAKAAAPFLRLADLSKRYGGVRALDGVAVDLVGGEVHCLVGENGSGKSTLIKIVSGVVRPEPGAVIAVDGAAVGPLTPALAKRLGIQVIFQDLSIFPNLSVAENIAFDEVLHGLAVSTAAVRRKARAAMGQIGLRLDPLAIAGGLPIAQRQLVAICRALATEARLIIMDEPTASLTKGEVDTLLGVVRGLKAKGLTVVFVSHRLDEVRAVADRVTVLRDGRKVGTWPVMEVDARRLAFLMTGHAFEQTVRLPLSEDRPAVLEVERLGRDGDYHDVSLIVRRGEVVGLTGLLGAGRTELALSLFGMSPAMRGRVRVDGREVRLRSCRDAIRAGIAYVPEDRLTQGLVMRQSVANNLVLGILHRLRNALGLLDGKKQRDAVRRWIGDLGIKVGDPADPVSSLSGGNQQRVVLGRWMATEPRLLILDSPTVGVDVAAKAGIFKIVHDLAARGVGILLISDEIGEVYHHCQRVLVIARGRIIAEVAPHALAEAELDRLVHG